MPVLSNAKWELFAQEVAKGTDLVDAYILAGYQRSLKNAQRLRKSEGVSSRIEEILSQSAQMAGVTAAQVIEELTHVAFADITEAVRWGEAVVALRPGTDDEFVFVQGLEMRPSQELPKHVRAAISEVRKTKEGLSIKFHNKLDALEKLGRTLGMFQEKEKKGGDTNFTWVTIIEQIAADRAAKTIEHEKEPNDV